VGLSGTGSIALQLAKKVYSVKHLITTVSTAKVEEIEELLGSGVIYQIIDYTKQDVLKEIEESSVDFYYDTTGNCMANLSLMKPKTGCIVSITSPPPGDIMAKFMPETPYILLRILDIMDWVNR
jgi:NADPH:quinone reductase-like Zn-dependent oxidoreductase